MHNAQQSSLSENSPRYFGWRVLAAAVIGMALSPGPLFWGSLGVFVNAFQAEFGWDRAEIMLALTWVTIASIPAVPLVGRLVDRLGVRRVLLPSIVLMAVVLALIPLALSSLTMLYVLFFFAGFLTAGAQSIAYIRVLASWFDQKRGLVIGITASGIGLGYAVIPPIVEWAINNHGWQAGYYALAAIVLGVSLPMMAVFIRNELNTEAGQHEATVPTANGVSLQAALKTREFWVIAVSILAVATVFNAMLPTMVPLLTDRSMSREEAVFAVSVMGVAMALSRIVVGYLIDHVFAPFVATVVFALASLGLLILALGGVGHSAYLAAFFIGLGFGAETDLMGFLVTRYFGLRHFGQIYGVILAFFLIGTGVGPYVLNLAYDSMGDYLRALWFGCLLGFLAAMAFLLLRHYPRTPW